MSNWKLVGRMVLPSAGDIEHKLLQLSVFAQRKNRLKPEYHKCFDDAINQVRAELKARLAKG